MTTDNPPSPASSVPLVDPGDARGGGAAPAPAPAGPTALSPALASGKVILLGEHAVVYGVPALAVGIERGARAWIEERQTIAPGDEASWRGKNRLRIRDWNVDVSATEPSHDLARAFSAVLDVTAAAAASSPAGQRFEREAVTVVVESELPPGAGLGCSAALGVAIARALAPAASLDAIGDACMAWERVFHGSPSGIDGAVAARGGCVLFQKGQRLETVRSKVSLTLCIGHTGISSSTKTMVESVAALRERRPQVVQQAFDGIASLTRNARLALEAGDRFALGRLLDLNQMLLSGLFVSTEEIERLCSAAREAGALGAKLTGAGGGGCVVALVPGPAVGERVLEAWKQDGFDGFMTRVAAAEAEPAVHCAEGPP